MCWSDPSNKVTLLIADLEPKITLQYNKEENRFFWENTSNFGVVQHYKFFVYHADGTNVVLKMIECGKNEALIEKVDLNERRE